MIAARSSGVRFLTLSMLAISAAVTALPASAQDVVREDDKPDLQFFVGLGLQVRPSFPGADSYDLGPLPVIRVRREGEPLPIRSPDQNTAFRLLGKRDGVSVGGTFNFQSARKEKDVGAPVGNVDFTFEPGVFAQGFLSDNLRLRAEVRRVTNILGRDGGYVLNSVHNIQADVPPENIAAMFDEAKAYAPAQ